MAALYNEESFWTQQQVKPFAFASAALLLTPAWERRAWKPSPARAAMW